MRDLKEHFRPGGRWVRAPQRQVPQRVQLHGVLDPFVEQQEGELIRNLAFRIRVESKGQVIMVSYKQVIPFINEEEAAVVIDPLNPVVNNRSPNIREADETNWHWNQLNEHQPHTNQHAG